MGTDHAERVRAWLDYDMANRPRSNDKLGVSYETVPLRRSDLGAVLDELKQLREEHTPRTVVCPVCQRPMRLTATGLIRYHGPHSRPCRGSGILPAVEPDGGTP